MPRKKSMPLTKVLDTPISTRQTRARAKHPAGRPKASNPSRSPVKARRATTKRPSRSSSSTHRASRSPSIRRAKATATMSTSFDAQHIYYCLYVALFLSAYFLLGAQLVRRFMVDNVVKALRSGRILGLLCEEAFYRHLLRSFMGYFDAVGRPLLPLLAIDGAFELLHDALGLSLRGRHMKGLVSGRFLIPFAAFLYVMLVMRPVTAVLKSPLLAALLSGLILARLVHFSFLFHKNVLNWMPKWLEYLRFHAYRLHGPLISLSFLFLSYEYLSLHPGMTMAMKTVSLALTIYMMRRTRAFHL